MSGTERMTPAQYRREHGIPPKPGDELANIAAPLLSAIARNVRRRHDEDDLLVTIVAWLRLALRPEVAFTHAANERAQVVEAKRQKAKGVMPGWPDLTFCWPVTMKRCGIGEGNVALLEVKTGRGSLSPAQRDFKRWADEGGIPFGVARSLDEAMAFVRGLGLVRDGYREVQPEPAMPPRERAMREKLAAVAESYATEAKK